MKRRGFLGRLLAAPLAWLGLRQTEKVMGVDFGAPEGSVTVWELWVRKTGMYYRKIGDLPWESVSAASMPFVVRQFNPATGTFEGETPEWVEERRRVPYPLLERIKKEA